MQSLPNLATVVIGRNEGDRLVACLESLTGTAMAVVYVDSGSTDDSVRRARDLGAVVVPLDMDSPFTAARARNAGVVALDARTDFVQFIDGDCRIHPDWIKTAVDFMEHHPHAAAAAGRLNEMHPEASIYNLLADAEWNTPIGQVKYCGGIAMMRLSAFRAVGGFDATLIAGEEPELCVRLRAAGWTIHRIDADMGWHDIAITHFSQWWQRTRRGGFAAAQGAAMHGQAPERHKVQETRRALIWGIGLPVVTLLGTMFTPWALLILLIWPVQLLRLRARGISSTQAIFMMLSKFPEAQGVVSYAIVRITRRRQGLIEYK